MPRRKPRKNTKTQPVTKENDAEQEMITIDKNEEALHDQEDYVMVSSFLFQQGADESSPFAIFQGKPSKPVILETGTDGEYQVQWKEKDGTLSQNQTDDHTLNAAFLHRLSIVYPGYSTGIASMGGFEFSNKSVKTGFFGAEKLQIRSMVLEEPSDSQIPELNNGFQTPDRQKMIKWRKLFSRGLGLIQFWNIINQSEDATIS